VNNVISPSLSIPAAPAVLRDALAFGLCSAAENALANQLRPAG